MCLVKMIKKLLTTILEVILPNKSLKSPIKSQEEKFYQKSILWVTPEELCNIFDKTYKSYNKSLTLAELVKIQPLESNIIISNSDPLEISMNVQHITKEDIFEKSLLNLFPWVTSETLYNTIKKTFKFINNPVSLTFLLRSLPLSGDTIISEKCPPKTIIDNMFDVASDLRLLAEENQEMADLIDPHMITSDNIFHCLDYIQPIFPNDIKSFSTEIKLPERWNVTFENQLKTSKIKRK